MRPTSTHSSTSMECGNRHLTATRSTTRTCTSRSRICALCLLRAMNRFDAALRIIGRINEAPPTWHGPIEAPWEIRHSSPATQALYDAYVDCLLACSSALLYLLYRLLIQVATEPLGDPAGPGAASNCPTRVPAARDLAFQRRSGPKLVVGQDAAPYALSNLRPGHILWAESWRNELTHNLGPAAFERPVYVGEGGDVVKGATGAGPCSSWRPTSTPRAILHHTPGCRASTSSGATLSTNCTGGWSKRLCG